MDCPFPKLYPSYLKKDDIFFMQLAYNMAIEAWKKDEVPVGAVVVFNSEIVACAHNLVESTQDPTAHAEMLAITQAASSLGSWRLNNATLYVTKEPCPMCAGATIMARLQRVVYAVSDPKMGCLGGACSSHTLPYLNHKVSVTAGVFESECKLLLQSFFEKKRK